jgi:hypothetical protein
MKANGGPSTNGKKPSKSDPSVSYDQFKEYEGKKYTGMKIGRSHKWYYDEGEWKETKVTPDLWQISYAVTKRRAGRAPEGSGVPVGTEYHWYILAHQNVTKLNANDYTTSMTGLKFKIAHKRADSGKWSATEKTQRKRMIRFLQEVIAELEQGGEQLGLDELEQNAKKPTRTKTTRKRPARKAVEAKEHPRLKAPGTPPSMKKAVRRRRKTTTAAK